MSFGGRLLGMLKLVLPGEADRVNRLHALVMLYRNLPTLPSDTERERVSRASWALIEQMGLPKAKTLISWSKRRDQAPFPSKENTKRYLLLRGRQVNGDSLHPDIVNGLGVLSFLIAEEELKTGQDRQAELEEFANELRKACGK